MRNSILDKFSKYIVCAIFYSMILYAIGFLIKNFTNISYKDILFLEGITSVVLGLMSSISGNSFGLSMGALGQSNSQYVSNVNLEAHKIEREKTKANLTILDFSLVSISIIMAGLVCIIGSLLIL